MTNLQRLNRLQRILVKGDQTIVCLDFDSIRRRPWLRINFSLNIFFKELLKLTFHLDFYPLMSKPKVNNFSVVSPRAHDLPISKQSQKQRILIHS
jgi:hypothetical protein